MSLYAEWNTALELRDSLPIRSAEWREANAEVCAIRFAMIAEARREQDERLDLTMNAQPNKHSN